MEKQNNNKGVITLLIVIIIILTVLCVLFATKIISFEANKNVNNQENNNDELIKEMTEIEATNAIKNTFINDTVQYLVDYISIPYCKRETTYISEKELGLDYQGNGFSKCTDFNSYEELTNHFKQYVTEDYFNSLLLKNNFLKQKVTLTDGTIMYNYYEKDGILYAANTGKGTNVYKYNFLNDETVYEIESFDNNEITATITAKWKDINGTIHSELEKMTIINDNGNWKVSSYETTQI